MWLVVWDVTQTSSPLVGDGVRQRLCCASGLAADELLGRPDEGAVGGNLSVKLGGFQRDGHLVTPLRL